ncbi:MAG: spore germination protein [Oscillospiraceae bacterium]
MSTFRIFSKKNKDGGGPHPRPEVSYDLPLTAENVKTVFSACQDFQTRAVWPGGEKTRGITLCWLDGVVSGKDVSEDVLRPFTDRDRFTGQESAGECMELLLHGGVYSGSVQKRDTMDDVVGDIVAGYCVFVFDSLQAAVSFETKTDKSRSVSEPTVEKTLKGAKDAFVEPLRTNTSLVRRHLRTPELKMEQTVVGRRSATQVAILYVNGIANGQTVAEVKRRLDDIDIDGLTSSGCLEQYIVDCPGSPFPQLLHTERPDKFVMELLNGRVGLIADGLPVGFLLPATMTKFMKVAEDRSQNYLVASALTLLRWLSLLLSTLLPALFVAVAMYHQEMIPTKLLLSMIEAKQKVPFSVAVEILSMLVAFELLQEAGLRLPNSVGDTVSIIGALIVGQSAVEARVVSPVAVIIVATAGICGFTLPSRDLASALRLVRFALVLFAIFLGLFGIMLGLVLLVWHLCSIDSYGVAYTSPLSEGGLANILRALTRPPLKAVKFRESALRTGDKRNQK